MSTSERAFDKVKSILGKLDRNIDAARARRLHGTPAPSPIPSPAVQAIPAPAGGAPGAPSFTPQLPLAGKTPEARPEGRSTFGRATPIRSSDR